MRCKLSRGPATVALVALFGVPSGAPAQTAEGWQEVVVIGRDCTDCMVTLAKDWRYQSGDDPAWADPEFDDSDWPLVLPSLRNTDTVPDGWSGIGWFRRRVMTTPEFGGPLGIYLVQAGASELYLDGRLVAEFGQVSLDPTREEAFLPQFVTGISLEAGTEHLLAVRYSNASRHVFERNFRGFEMHVGEIQALSAFGIQKIRAYTAFMASTLGVFGAFTLLHLLLFAFQPRARENLYFATFTGSMVAIMFAEMQMSSAGELSRVLFFYKWFLTAALVMALSAVLLEHRVFKHRIGTIFWVLIVASAAALVWIWTRSAFGGSMPVAILIAVIYLVTLWLAILAMIESEPDAWILGLGFSVLTLSIFAALLGASGLIEVSPWLTALVGVGAPALSFSVYLSRRVARTNRQLEAKLEEVETLTRKAIEQERIAAREEAERRVLEADYARKSAELEEARELQLAMLPKQVPDLDRFEVAVHMSTANEVGGDYYDFHTNGSRTCTVALGDATGHGLHAGMVVGVAKSLFQTCRHDTDLRDLLGRIGDGLSSMHRRQASMAMLLARIEPERLTVTSAGMPPLLIWRKATSTVEEILLPGVPLATLRDRSFAETVIDLEDGDAVLMMTDGLAEVVNPSGELLGYERASELFAQVADLQPDAALQQILQSAAVFNEGTPLQDDLTLLLLKAKP